MAKTEKEITFQVTFKLTDLNKLINTYPNFAFNYDSFENWAKSNVKELVAINKEVKGCRISVKQVNNK